MSESDQERRAFAAMFIERLRAAGDTRELTFDEENFRIRADAGNSLNLGNCFAEYQAAPPGDREKLLSNVVRAWFAPQREMPETFDLARADLLPAVRHRSFFDLLMLEHTRNTAETKAVPYEPFGEHLAVSVVYDLPEAMQWISSKQLEDWDTSLETALAAATENLRQMSAEPLRKLAPGIYQSAWRDNYDASRIILPEVFENLEISGDLIAALPNRDALIVADSTDESALWMLCNLVEDISSKPRQLTTTLFRRLAEDAWAPWIPEPGTRNYQRIRTLHMRELAACYAEQKRLLQDMEPSEEDPPFIASLMAVQRAGSRVPITYCVWGEGVDALLPWAEYVTFARQGDEQSPPLVGGAWERVCEIVGGLMEPQQLYPPRYRVRQFPSEAQLAEIGPLEI